MGKIFSLIIILLFLDGCGGSSQKDNPGVIAFDKYSPELANAKQEAIKSLGQFVSAFQSNKNDTTYFFSVKVEFSEGELSEHMWLEVVEINRRNLRGKIGNEPQVLEKLNYGEIVKLNVSEIEDWMIYDRGKDTVIGAFFLRAIGKEDLLH